jgi:hypothetical protein
MAGHLRGRVPEPETGRVPEPESGEVCDALAELALWLPASLSTQLPDELPPGSPVDVIAEVLGSEPSHVWLPRWFGPLAVLSVIGFVPWMVYLAFTLPRKVRADHYDIAWLGFDIALWLSIAGLAYCAVRRRPGFGPLAAVTSALLFVDAWFDVITSSSRGEFIGAVALAACAEVPAAVICAWMAVNAETIHARAYRRMRVRMQWAVVIARRAVVAAGPDALSLETDPQAPQ